MNIILAALLAAQPVTFEEWCATGQGTTFIVEGREYHCPVPGDDPGRTVPAWRCDPDYHKRTDYQFYADDAPDCPGLSVPPER